MTSGNLTSFGLVEDLYRRRTPRLLHARSRTRSRRLRHALSRGVSPYFLALDLSAAAVAVPVMGSWDRLDAFLVAVCLALFGLCGAYKSRLNLSILQDGGRLATRAVVAGALVVSGDALLGGGPHGELVRTTLGLAVGVLLIRTLGYAVVRECRARGLVTHRTIVLGAGQVGAQIFDLLVAHPEYGLRPVGFIDANPLLAEHQLPAPVLGGDDELARLIAEHQVEDVIVAFGRLPGHRLVEVIRTCDRLQCEIFFVPRLFELHATEHEMDHIWGIPLIRHRRAAFRSPSWRVKRLVDVLGAAAALLALSPVLLALAVAVYLEDGPGIIFRQTRAGLDGRPFNLLKFRSLTPVDDEESATRWAIATDDRVGRVGRLLRKSSLDELPQLWNILRGDMSLVGPRPERPHFVDTFASTLPRYVARHRVPAGLTGWAQVHGLRGDTSIAERARFDNYYIENWSLGLDLRILLMTLVSVVTRRGG